MTRFLFERSFDAPTPNIERPKKDEPPPPPAFSEAELAEARRQAYEEGHRAGLSEAMSSIEAQCAVTIQRIADSLDSVVPQHTAVLERYHAESLSIARAIVAKLVDEATRENALKMIETTIATVLPKLMDEPRAVIRVGDTVLDALQDRVRDIAGRTGFTGEVILLAEGDLGPGDCTVEWADGGAEYHQDAIWQDIDEAIERYRAGLKDAVVPQEPDTQMQSNAEETPNG